MKNNVKGAHLEIDISLTIVKEIRNEKDLNGLWLDWRRCNPRG